MTVSSVALAPDPGECHAQKLFASRVPEMSQAHAIPALENNGRAQIPVPRLRQRRPVAVTENRQAFDWRTPALEVVRWKGIAPTS